ncbi:MULTISPECIES: enoyl-CoA hydratase-related protein [unclassified Sphingomonas]|jgi:2-(1,2-epoxy-1,2-dihydrophenyl)acetyl-CoA isomerase|uniref:enoyl-CoA hydratase/isomerase family protein n=1 Tax=unclassified Sphingomonas TaxID=196159 RepID=UPI00095BB1F1|nr:MULTISPECIES: enoyl-CoA hydratase-related protein [unclassified Sphingomonas]MBN8812614.1 enoyl-CoA hydratase/isomerase family protein [Sphingomonas sp.]OJY53583.1 MAG: enoyl-CoA hydratase [Sphingomonas sp. 67-41]HCW61513.1 enoyl-CoA hydratase [Sphingobium sp.]|tara:strand:+ start:2943 stop:3725 length:783 start_codon:yes stop_codon:yes gene_type:complete
MTGAGLRFEREGAVARLVLDRPDAANSINLDLAKALARAAVQCDEDATIRSVVLTARGKLFCPGGDVGAFASAGDGLPALLKDLTIYLHQAVSRLARMEKPLVTAVNGAAAGAGFSLAILGDIALAARSATFNVAYGAIGLSPDGGSTWLLPRLVGLRRAQEIMLRNQRLGAEQAAELGVVTRVVDDGALLEEAMAIAHELATGPTFALGRTRALLLNSFGESLEAQMEFEARSIVECGRSAHGQAGVAAFLARRKPEFD